LFRLVTADYQFSDAAPPNALRFGSYSTALSDSGQLIFLNLALTPAKSLGACGNVILVGGLAYLFIHFFLYAVCLRRVGKLKTEGGIFRYHFFSAIFIACVTLVLMAGGLLERPWAILTALLSLHGIYSISFLEVWSLAQGGYSLSILERAAQDNGITPEQRSQLEAIGDQKRESRLRALLQLALIRKTPAGICLTPFGRTLSIFFHAVVRATNLRSLG
jgi:hypothetical protein